MIRKYHKIILFVLLVVSCTAFIFSNSIKDIEASRSDSDVIVEVVEAIYNKINASNDLNFDYIVRKGAHLLEFFVLGICTTLLYVQISKKYVSALVIVFMYVIVVAFADEFIQRFTGRGYRITDIMIDIIGAFIGIFVLLFADMMVKRLRGHVDK